MEHAQAEQAKDYKAAPEAAAAAVLAGKKGDAAQGESNLEATLLNSMERPALEFHSNMSAAPMERRFEDAALTQLSVSTPVLSARPRRIDDETRERERRKLCCVGDLNSRNQFITCMVNVNIWQWKYQHKKKRSFAVAIRARSITVGCQQNGT